MRKTSLMLLGAATGVALAIVAMQPRVAFSGAEGRPVPPPANYRVLNLFGDTFERVRSRYVETPSDRELIGAAINGMLSSLEDSYYVDAKSMNHLGACSGPGCEVGDAGVSFTVADGVVKVITAIADSPAAAAGLMAGDIITDVDDEPMQGLNFYQVAEKLRGEAGKAVRLTVVRPDRTKVIETSIVRERINMRSVRARADSGDIGYIRITQFNEQTADQLKKSFDEIAAAIVPGKLKGYVIDLRNNPGGLPDAAVAVADAFLDDGEIVSIRGRKTEDIRHFRAKAGDLAKGRPLIVLINAGSALTAEIVAGALQDHRRATVVGTRSFGQGSASTLIPLGQDNGAIHLTTGHYFTPSGRLIEGKGIAPDVEVLQELPDDLKPDVKSAGNEKSSLQSYVPPDAQADKALNRAFELLRRTAKDTASRPAKSALPN
jgi:carboxyl-terminal processing protease